MIYIVDFWKLLLLSDFISGYLGCDDPISDFAADARRSRL